MNAFMGRLMCSWACIVLFPFIIGGEEADEEEDVEVEPEEEEKKYGCLRKLNDAAVVAAAVDACALFSTVSSTSGTSCK